MGFETDDTFESDLFTYYIFKYLPFLFGGLVLFWASDLYLSPEKHVAKDGALPDFWSAIILGLFGVLFILLAVLIYQKLVRIEMDYQIIKIKKEGKVIEVKWLDVESIKMIPTVTPPLYKLRLKNYEDYFLFNTQGKGIQLFIFIWDWSDMGKLIRDKKERFGL